MMEKHGKTATEGRCQCHDSWARDDPGVSGGAKLEQWLRTLEENDFNENDFNYVQIKSRDLVPGDDSVEIFLGP